MAIMTWTELNKRKDLFIQLVEENALYFEKSGKKIDLHKDELKRLPSLLSKIKSSKQFDETFKQGGKFYPVIRTTSGRYIAFNEISKTRTFFGVKKVGNKGDIAEGIFAAGIYARFLSKTRNVSIDDIKSVLRKAGKQRSRLSGKTTDKMFLSEKSPNANGVIYDDVELTIILAPGHMDSLLNEDFWNRDLKQLFQATIAYANSKVIADWADLLYNNNKRNTIEVISAGTEDQTGTKVDVFVLIDGKRVNINVSLKVGDVKQFGQVGGTDFQKHVDLWSGMGINVYPLKDKYYKFLADKGPAEAFTLLYQKVSGSKIKARDFINFIQHHATLKEEGVTLVQLSKDTKVYDFDKLDKFRGEIVTKLSKDRVGKPILIFSSRPYGDLIQIRMKIENLPKKIYTRTYIEKQNGLTALIANQV